MLNEVYEQHFGFRFVVFVAGRPLSAIPALMEAAMRNDRPAELGRGLDEVVDIAADRLGRLRGDVLESEERP
jgi:2-oxo-4-hydroxy-4-carboxy--5-ureidoimidazoline (OHCU) decarboxylase